MYNNYWVIIDFCSFMHGDVCSGDITACICITILPDAPITVYTTHSAFLNTLIYRDIQYIQVSKKRPSAKLKTRAVS